MAQVAATDENRTTYICSGLVLRGLESVGRGLGLGNYGTPGDIATDTIKEWERGANGMEQWF